MAILLVEVVGEEEEEGMRWVRVEVRPLRDFSKMLLGWVM